MKLFIIRHGEAKRNGKSDYERELTSQGEKDVTRVSAYLNKIKILPDLILSSPLFRAKQTAEIIAQNLECDPKNIYYDEDIAYGRLEQIIALLKEPEFKTGILVGHMPMVSHIIDYFDERKTFDEYYLEPADFALINFEHVLKKNSGRVTIFKKNTLTSHKE